MKTAIALDLGSTSIKAGLLDEHGTLSNIVSQPAPPVYAQGERYESDALAYATIAEQVLSLCLAQTTNLPPLGLCSQRSSFLIWEQDSGKPVTPLISWQDTRGTDSCIALQAQELLITELTGLRLTPYYFAAKLRVVLLDNPQWRDKLQRGELLVGTLDTFLIWRWTNGKQHITDVSMAARTLLMDIRIQQWSPVLCELFGIPLGILPTIKPSTALNLSLTGMARIFLQEIKLTMPFSPTRACLLSLQRHYSHGLPLAGATLPRKERRQTNRYASSTPMNGLTLQAAVADQSAALLASVGEAHDIALVNLGTGGFVIRYLPESREMQQSHHNMADGYLRTLVYQDNTRPAHIAIEGTLNSIAAALAPYPVSDCKLEDFAAMPNIYCIAEPSGIGAPYFRKDIGLKFSQSVEHLSQLEIACLLLEAIVFRVVRIVEDFHRAVPIKRVYLSGGLSELSSLQQGIAQCLPCEVFRLQQHDASLQGAAMLAVGMKQVKRQEVEKILVENGNQVLSKKYLHWKEWLDSLLNTL